ncbi:class I SAM-dependent methyltransferase [Streptosporangium sp. NPDC002524]|uniref:class I SAM-dependent methyltransferase n=1 Tax=Streptosporangium sp. NPDC002524 TaxID=3154537 RepID=UPI00332FE64C
MTQQIQEATRADIAAIDISDICTPEYTVKLERIRYEAALVLSRIAMKHIFATGEAVHDPEAPPPSTGSERQPHFFRKRLIEYLADRGDLVRDGYVYRPTAELVERAGTREGAYLAGVSSPDTATMVALRAVESVAGEVLRGRDGLAAMEERIGVEETWRIWQYLMVDVAPKQTCNSLVARVLDQRLRAGDPIVVFEGGAGVGATVRAALQIDGFRERARAIRHYGFTDISRDLMRGARQMLQEEAPELLAVTSFDRVDLDDLDSYDDVPYLRDGSADLIILENVLHDVENLHEVLRACHRILKPGGWLTFTSGNRTRPGMFFPCEVLQTSLHSYNRAVLDPPRRVNVGYLTQQEWAHSLTDAGFPSFRALPGESDLEFWPFGGFVAERP